MTPEEEFEVIADEVAKIHADFEKGHTRLQELVRRRDELLYQTGQASGGRPGGTVIEVPVAMVKFQ